MSSFANSEDPVKLHFTRVFRQKNTVFNYILTLLDMYNGLSEKGSLTVWVLYAYFTDSQNAAYELLVWCM